MVSGTTPEQSCRLPRVAYTELVVAIAFLWGFAGGTICCIVVQADKAVANPLAEVGVVTGWCSNA